MGDMSDEINGEKQVLFDFSGGVELVENVENKDRRVIATVKSDDPVHLGSFGVQAEEQGLVVVPAVNEGNEGNEGNSDGDGAREYTLDLLEVQDEKEKYLVRLSDGSSTHFARLPLEMAAGQFPILPNDLNSEDAVLEYVRQGFDETEREKDEVEKNKLILELARKIEGLWIELSEKGSLDWIDKPMRELVMAGGEAPFANATSIDYVRQQLKGRSESLMMEGAGGFVNNYWLAKEVVGKTVNLLSDEEKKEARNSEEVWSAMEVYRLLCEGLVAPDIVSIHILLPLAKELRKYGREARYLLNQYNGLVVINEESVRLMDRIFAEKGGVLFDGVRQGDLKDKSGDVYVPQMNFEIEWPKKMRPH